MRNSNGRQRFGPETRQTDPATKSVGVVWCAMRIHEPAPEFVPAAKTDRGRTIGELRKILLSVPRARALGFFVGVGAIAISLLCASGFRNLAGVQPVFLDPPSASVGTVLQGEIVRKEFHLHNRGDAEMRVVGARTSCGCTLFPQTLIATLIRPHSSVVVPVEYHSGLGDGQVSGDLEITVAGQGIDYICRGSLQGNVVAEFTIEPQHMDFGNLKPGEEVTRTLLFRPKACQDLKITGPRSILKPFEVVLESGEVTALGPGPRVLITFRAPPEAIRRQVFASAITFTTSSKRVPTAVISVLGQVSPDIDITPDQVVLPGEGVVGESRIRIRTAEPSRIARVTRKTSEGLSEMGRGDHDSGAPGDWALVHTLRLANDALAAAEQIDFWLEVLHGTHRTEARCVSVPIKRLDNKKG